MELDLQSLFGLYVHSCTHWLRTEIPPPPSPRIWAHIRGRYWSAKIDDISSWQPDDTEQALPHSQHHDANFVSFGDV